MRENGLLNSTFYFNVSKPETLSSKWFPLVSVFKAKYTEMRWVMEKSAGGSGGGSGDDASGDDDFVVRLRGLPFDSSREDVSKFFDGMMSCVSLSRPDQVTNEVVLPRTALLNVKLTNFLSAGA